MNQVDPSSMNSPHANIISAVLPISWITSVHPVIRQSFMDTSSIPIVIRQVRQHQIFGSYRIVSQLWQVWNLSIIIAMVHPDNNGQSVKTFITNLKSNGWIVSSSDVSYSDLGNSIAGSCWLILGIHLSCAANVEPLLLEHPPAIPSHSLAGFIWEPFHWPEHSISLARNDPGFATQDGPTMTITLPKSATHSPSSVHLKYHIHHAGSDNSILVGLDVISVDGLCPAFNAYPNLNIFQAYFGVKFHYDGHSYICAISPFEFVRCFGFLLTNWHIASHNHHTNSALTPWCLLTLPRGYSNRSTLILVYLRDSNCE